MDKMRDRLQDATAPPISERTAILCGLLFTFFYVSPFYISPTLRTSAINSRDSPRVIKARVHAVLYSILASTIVTVIIHLTQSDATPSSILRLFGVWPMSPLDILKLLGLLCVLFAGPLFETLVVNSSYNDFTLENIKTTFWTSPTSHRNVVVAPWCEELVFRSLVISLYLLADVSPSRIIFTSPLIFGAAHVHHLIEIIKNRIPAGKQLPSVGIVLMCTAFSIFQFIYTTIFGAFAAFVYLRTGNVFAVVAAHTFCNFMGLPKLWGRLKGAEVVGATPDVAQGKPPAHIKGVQHAQTLHVGWTAAYYALIFAGGYGFYGMLWPLTESAYALAAI